MQDFITFNHGVEGSSPSALTNEIKVYLIIAKTTDTQNCGKGAVQKPG